MPLTVVFDRNVVLKTVGPEGRSGDNGRQIEKPRLLYQFPEGLSLIIRKPIGIQVSF